MSRKTILIRFLLLALAIPIPVISLAEEPEKTGRSSRINVSAFSYSRNKVGIDHFYADEYLINNLPRLRYSFAGKGFSYRTGASFFGYHNAINTKSFGAMDSYRSVDADYFQADAWFGIEKKLHLGILSFNYFIESGPGLVFYSGEYSSSLMADPFNSPFTTRAIYLNVRPGVGLEIRTFRKLSIFIESAVVVDRLIFKSNDDFDLLIRSRLSPEPVGQLGISYTFR